MLCNAAMVACSRTAMTQLARYSHQYTVLEFVHLHLLPHTHSSIRMCQQPLGSAAEPQAGVANAPRLY